MEFTWQKHDCGGFMDKGPVIRQVTSNSDNVGERACHQSTGSDSVGQRACHQFTDSDSVGQRACHQSTDSDSVGQRACHQSTDSDSVGQRACYQSTDSDSVGTSAVIHSSSASVFFQNRKCSTNSSLRLSFSLQVTEKHLEFFFSFFLKHFFPLWFGKHVAFL